MLSWQQHHRCNFVSFVMEISVAKFEEHRFGIVSPKYKLNCASACTAEDISSQKKSQAKS